MAELDAVARVNAAVDELVQELEDLFQMERQAWVSTSMTTKLMSKQAKEFQAGADSASGGGVLESSV